MSIKSWFQLFIIKRFLNKLRDLLDKYFPEQPEGEKPDGDT